jgi:hypothetical protein
MGSGWSWSVARSRFYYCCRNLGNLPTPAWRTNHKAGFTIYPTNGNAVTVSDTLKIRHDKKEFQGIKFCFINLKSHQSIL